MAHRKPSTSHRSPASRLVDIITYRYNGDLMYVPVAENYAQALVHLRDAFPQLKTMKDSSLILSLNIINGTDRKLVGITPAAWPKIVPHLARYEVLDVQVAPLANIPTITITVADDDEPAPPYQGHSGTTEADKACLQVNTSSSSPFSSGRFSPRWLLSKLNRT